jgi:glycosyltransferase involved in cell wall biosynthesis
MRIVLVTSALSADTRGGAEKYVEDAARSLAAGHDVTVLTGSKAHAEGIELIRLPGLPYHDAGAGSAASRVLWHARDQWRLQVHRAAVRGLGEIRPDVVWTHEPQGLSAAIFTAVAKHGAPHVHTAHDLNLLCARTSMTRHGSYCGGRCLDCAVQRQLRGRAIKRRLDRFIGVSDYITDRHVHAGIVDRERAATIRVGAEPGTVRIREASATPTLGFIGALAEHKGVRTLLHTMGSAPPGWRLLVAGTGPLTEAVEASARADARVEYLGYVDTAAKDEFFNRVDLLVVPSEWEEPGPFVVMEAAVRGIPAVVSDRGGLPETPQARTFRSGDPGSLLAAIGSFVEAEGELATASRLLVEHGADYTWSNHLARIEGLLENAADEASASREE